MQMSDNTQHQRRVRVLFDNDDLKMLLARAVAAEAKVDLTDPDVRVEMIHLVSDPLPGCAAAEVIVVVDHPHVRCASAPTRQTEADAVRGAAS